MAFIFKREYLPARIKELQGGSDRPPEQSIETDYSLLDVLSRKFAFQQNLNAAYCAAARGSESEIKLKNALDVVTEELTGQVTNLRNRGVKFEYQPE